MAETKPSPPRHDPRVVVAAPRTTSFTICHVLDHAVPGSAQAGPVVGPERLAPRFFDGGWSRSPGVVARAHDEARSSTSDVPGHGSSKSRTEVVPT